MIKLWSMIEIKKVCAECPVRETCEIDKEEFQNEINLAIGNLDGEEAYDSIEMYRYIQNCIKVLKEEKGCEGDFNSRPGSIMRLDQ